jgi:hypothetical protein
MSLGRIRGDASIELARLAGVFSRLLIIDSALSAAETRMRVRAFATSRDLPQLDAYRRRQIVSWRLSRANEESLFQPEYGDVHDIEGARFVGLVEPVLRRSRIRGYVVVSLLTRIIVSVVMLAVGFAATAALRQGAAPAVEVLSIAAATSGGTLAMLRYSLRSSSRVVAMRLQQCLEVRGPRAAA